MYKTQIANYIKGKSLPKKIMHCLLQKKKNQKFLEFALLHETVLQKGVKNETFKKRTN